MESTSEKRKITRGNRLLRGALLGNAVFSGMSGLVFSLASSSVAGWLAIGSPAIILAVGLMLITFSAALFYAALQTEPDSRLAISASLADMGWVLGSVLLLMLLPMQLNAMLTIAGIAAMVALFGTLQFIGVRRLSLQGS